MAQKAVDGYPAQYETEVILKDGSRMMIRPIRREDADLWLEFVAGLSPRTKFLRFHALPKLGPEDAARYCGVDYRNTFAFVAETMGETRPEIVAIGRYYRLPDQHSAEVAVVIADAHQGRGIGTKLMELLAEVGRENGIQDFEADVLAENKEMMAVLRDYGFQMTSDLQSGVIHVKFPIARTKRILKGAEERERISTVASVHSLMYPKSVAVIGASPKPGTIGNLLFKCIMENGYAGIVYPINPNAKAVQSVRAYPSILAVEDKVDLALIAVPAPVVPKVADECGRKGVHAIVVISDGFKERGGEGAQRERQLRDITLGHGMRLVGPNCLGLINTDPTINLNASFSPIYPPPGQVAFLSQSGGLGLAILAYAKRLNMGISAFLSVGNRADISANDLLQYWEQDPGTTAILLYLESFGNPRKFARIARRVSASKPIVVVKSGTSPAGSRAASSHTGALATSDVATDALFRQAGIIRVDTLERLFDVATLLSSQPLPRGRRVAILTNGGGPGILAADACENQGLVLPEFSPESVEAIRSVCKREIGIHNPLDLTAGATAGEYEGVLKLMARDPGLDVVILIFAPPVIVASKAMEDAIGRVAPLFARHRKPLLACFMGQRGLRAKLGAQARSVPCYPFPESAVSALARSLEYSGWLKRPRGAVPRIRGIKRERARKMIERAMTRSVRRPLWLSSQEIARLLGCYGIRFVETATCRTAAAAAAAAARIGFPVAVKLASSTIVHKTEVGGVKLDLRSEDEVKQAFHDIEARLAAAGRRDEMEGVTVQRMIEGVAEAIVGVTQDPSFGPLIMFGLGGIYAELMKDVAVRLHPLTDTDARELVSSIKMKKLFEGFRGAPPADMAALEDLLLRLSALIEDAPQIAELDFNPVVVRLQGDGYCVVDARILAR